MSPQNYSINSRLFDPYLERMNFLNEVSILNPKAISFGSGRPDEAFFNVKGIIDHFYSYASLNVRDEPAEVEKFYNSMGQYNKTNGIINAAVSRLLEQDEGIKSDPEDILLTNGGQEGMAIVINSLFENSDDILMISDPSYIGFVGYAKICGVTIAPIRRDRDSMDLAHLEETILRLKKQGKNPKVLYEVVDFHNPTGDYMPLEKRRALIRLAEKHNFLIVEDNPYGYFIYDTLKIPTLKALDEGQRVIHLGSFAKTIFPALRLGYLVVDQRVPYKRGSVRLADEFKKTKSFISVNTSTLLQAMAGSYLHSQNYSLKAANESKIAALRLKRDTMLAELEYRFPGRNGGVGWQKPSGGFFLTVDVPFKITDQLLKECVEKYEVIFCPMSYFFIEEARGDRQMRLAFSNLGVEAIRAGITRLAEFIKSKM